jgi:UDP-glucose-4-epimerase
MTVLVVGGAGYIGAHVVRLLRERGDEVVVVDDLSTGAPERIGDATLVPLDIALPSAPGELERLMTERRVDAVIHFAARKRVDESVERPIWYTEQNVGGLANVLSAVQGAGVERVVFSSSAAVYGMPDTATVDEDTPCVPINPYGRTKLVGEWMVEDAARAWGLHTASLRYFNVAGAGWPDLGDPSVQNLVTIVFDRMSRGEQPVIFGDDYPTPDGTCIRDYVHVLDLAEAHIAALRHVAGSAAPHTAFNVGTGTGYSVREVVAQIAATTGRGLEPVIAPRRVGDPARVVADVTKIRDELGWSASRTLPQIVGSAWEARPSSMGGRVE